MVVQQTTVDDQEAASELCSRFSTHFTLEEELTNPLPPVVAYQGRSQEFILTEARGLMASAGARAYNGGLGAEPPAPPAGSRGRAPGQGGGEAPLKLNASKLRSAHRKAQIWPCLRNFSV